MDERFLRSCYCGTHRVLGLKLKPYSLSHLLALEAIKSPLVQSGTRGTIRDLVSAVRICAEDRFTEEPETFVRPKHRFYDLVTIFILTLFPSLVINQIIKFYTYTSAYSQIAEFWEKGHSVEELPEDSLITEELGSSITGPYLLAQAVAVMMHYPQMTERRVWTMGIGLMSWYNGQIAEYKYQQHFWSEEQGEEIESKLQEAEAGITPEMRAMADKITKQRKLAEAGSMQTVRIGEVNNRG